MISKEKMSKKEQKKLNSVKRTTWAFSPVTRVKPNKKVYNRKDKYEVRSKTDD